MVKSKDNLHVVDGLYPVEEELEDDSLDCETIDEDEFEDTVLLDELDDENTTSSSVPNSTLSATDYGLRKSDKSRFGYHATQ